MTQIKGTVLDRLSPALKLDWDQDHFILDINGRRFTMPANELCDLARELLRAAVTKGGF